MDSEYYLNLFKALLIKTQSSTNIERDKAILIALDVMHETNKDRRVEEMKADREKQRQEPATARQIAYMKILGIKTEEGISKQNATKIIEQAVRR
jgi:hypothetical protein